MNALNPKNKHSMLSHNKKLIEGLTDRAAEILDDTWFLWEIDPSSKELRDKFYVLEQCLDHIKMICKEKT